MSRQFIILAAILTLMACREIDEIDLAQLSQKERHGVESLLWLKKADAEQDAQTALSRNDKRLLVMAGRSPSLPGIEPELTSKAKSVCGIRYIEGSTDTVLGEIHLELLQAASDYASAYNRILIKHCLDK